MAQIYDPVYSRVPSSPCICCAQHCAGHWDMVAFIAGVAWAGDAPPRLHILTVTEQVRSSQQYPPCSREENLTLLLGADPSPSPHS